MAKYRNKKKTSRFNPLEKKDEKKTKTPPSTSGLDAIYGKICDGAETIFLPALFDLGRLSGDDIESVRKILLYSDKDVGPGAFIRKLNHFLLKGTQEVKIAAAGTLRNLSSHGDAEAVGLLLAHGALQPALCCVAAAPLRPEPCGDANRLLEQLCHALYNICEVSPPSVALVTPLLPRLAPYALLPPSATSIGAATVLLCLTEDNPPARDLIDEQMGGLSARVTEAWTEGEDAVVSHHRLLLAGVLANLGAADGAPLRSALLRCSAALTPPATLLGRCAHVPEEAAESETEEASAVNGNNKRPRSIDSKDIQNMMRIDSSSPNKVRKTVEGSNDKGVALMEAENGDVLIEVPQQVDSSREKEDNSAITHKNYEVLQHQLEAYQLALEVIMKLLEEDEDEEVVEDPRINGDEDGMEGDVEMDEGEGGEEGGDEWEEMPGIVREVCEWLVANGVVEKMLESLRSPEPDLMKLISGSVYGKSLSGCLSVCRQRCLLAIEAAAEHLSLEELGGADKVLKAWTLLLGISSENEGLEVMEAVAGAMRAYTLKLRVEDISRLNPKDILKHMGDMSAAVRKFESEGVRVDLVSMMAHLGEMLVCSVATASPEALAKDAVAEVLTGCTKDLVFVAGTDKHLHVVAACLDALMDLYKEDVTDRLAFDVNLCADVRRVFECFITKYKLKENKKSAHKPLLDTVAANIPLFLKYKQTRVNNVDPSKKHIAKAGKHKKTKK